MPILDLQKSLRRLGKIRMGDQRPSQGGKLRPAKLSEWRITSPSLELIEQVAGVYGGAPQVWEGSPSEGREYEVYTESDTLRVVVPGDFTFSQWRELWSAGGCQRRCDGRTEQLTDGPCVCPADVDERAELAKAGKACKDTTRLSVLLPDIPDIGVWMLESHGFYAAVELAGAIEVIGAANGRMIPAQLRIDQRTVKRPGRDGKPETRRFAVPVLELTTVTAGMLMAGQASGELTAGTPVAPPRAAIGSGGGEATASKGSAEHSAAAADAAPSARSTSAPPPPLPGDDDPPASSSGGADWMARINAISDTREKKACMDAFKESFGAPPFTNADRDVAERILGAFEPKPTGGNQPPLPGEDEVSDDHERRLKALMATAGKAFPCDDAPRGEKTRQKELLRHAAVCAVLGEHKSASDMTVDELGRVERWLHREVIEGSAVFEILDEGVVRITLGDQTVDVEPMAAVPA